MAKPTRPKLPKMPSREQIEEIRRKASADLERLVREPLSEKAKLDMATLDSVSATKH